MTQMAINGVALTHNESQWLILTQIALDSFGRCCGKS